MRGRHLRSAPGVLVAALVVGCTPPPRPVAPAVGVVAPSSPWNPSLAEQLRIGWFDYERLSDSIPGFAGLSHGDCEVSVHLTHPERDAERARRVLEPALDRGGRCVAALRVERARSTYREMRELGGPRELHADRIAVAARRHRHRP